MKTKTKTEYHVTIAHHAEHPCGIPLAVGTVIKTNQEPFPWYGGMSNALKGRPVIMVMTGHGDRAPFDTTGHTVDVVTFEKPVPEWAETSRTLWESEA